MLINAYLLIFVSLFWLTGPWYLFKFFLFEDRNRVTQLRCGHFQFLVLLPNHGTNIKMGIRLNKHDSNLA